jgi:hypothetical protein
MGRPGNEGSILGAVEVFSLLHNKKDHAWHPPWLSYSAYEGTFLEGTVQHSRLSRYKVKNARQYTSTPKHLSNAWCLREHMINSTFISNVMHVLGKKKLRKNV